MTTSFTVCASFVVLYRPPTSSKTPQFSVFLSEFTGLLEALNQAFGDVVITGDFNIHVGSGITNADGFEQLLVSFNFSHLVKAQTRRAKTRKWQKLDLILTRESSNFCDKKTHNTFVRCLSNFSIVRSSRSAMFT